MNGRDVIHSLQQGQPDLVLPNALLEDMDGCEFRRQLHELTKTFNYSIMYQRIRFKLVWGKIAADIYQSNSNVTKN